MSFAVRLGAPALCLALALAVPAFASSPPSPPDDLPADRVRLAGMPDVAAGGEHSCGIRATGTLWCWGRNSYGQIGNGTASQDSEPPTQVGAKTDWLKVTGGGASTCAIRTNQALYGWGLNHRGQVGDETRTVRAVPTQVPGASRWRSVSMGFFHTCGINSSDTLRCWGDNSAGQLGQGNTKRSLERQKVAGNWSTVSAGGWTTCATKVNGTLWCWGRNLFGQVGDGSYADRAKPTRVGTSDNWRQVDVSWTHTCGRTSGGAVRCWGRNTQGQLGTGNTIGSATPRLVRGGHQAASIGLAEGTSCLVEKGGAMWCWGDNRYRQIGAGSDTILTPVKRAGSYSAVSGGWLHVCAASGDASVCWGNNERGQLGDGKSVRSRIPRIAAPAPAPRRAPFSFRLASINVLGNGHSKPYAHDDRFGPSRMRADWTAQALITNRLDVAGLQEPTAGQLQGILTAARGRYAAYPGPGAGDLAVEAPLVWDTRKYEATKTMTIRTQFIARVLKRPVVRLKDRATGREFWVMNVHNAPWDYQEKRNKAVKVQIAKIQELEQSGLPVFYIGDFNEKRTILCKVLKRTGLISPYGGRINQQGKCVEPRQRMRVDWIFGSGIANYSGFAYSRPPLVRLSTDHWVPVVNVQVP